MLEWVKPPLQARTRQALSRMLDAAEALVAQKGFDNTSIIEIAQRSGASVGGFYRRFRDKQGLLQALHERLCDEARATADVVLDPARWGASPTREIVAEMTAFLVRVYHEREGLFRAFALCGIDDDQVRLRTQDLFAHLAERLGALFRDRRDEIGHPDPEFAATFGLHLVVSALNHAIQGRPAALDLNDTRLTAELTRAFLAYLGVPGEERHPPWSRA